MSKNCEDCLCDKCVKQNKCDYCSCGICGITARDVKVDLCASYSEMPITDNPSQEDCSNLCEIHEKDIGELKKEVWALTQVVNNLNLKIAGSKTEDEQPKEDDKIDFGNAGCLGCILKISQIQTLQEKFIDLHADIDLLHAKIADLEDENKQLREANENSLRQSSKDADLIHRINGLLNDYMRSELNGSDKEHKG
jgi:hypothetical protein